MKKALLLVDRGSREPEVREELEELCVLANRKAAYNAVSYCFLEVVSPFIEEGINRCLDSGADRITVMPYFLYPGMKLKDTVKTAARIMNERGLKMAIAKPLSYHGMMAQLITERLTELKFNKGLDLPDSECDVLLIGHGSSDKNAHDAFMHPVEAIRRRYRRVHHCFLELDSPDIKTGLSAAVQGNPNVILMMPYFLHRGAHIKRDVIEEIESALSLNRYENAHLARHLGVDEKLVDLILERTNEVERRAGF